MLTWMFINFCWYCYQEKKSKFVECLLCASKTKYMKAYGHMLVSFNSHKKAFEAGMLLFFVLQVRPTSTSPPRGTQ